MKVVILGAAGFVGRNLLAGLHDTDLTISSADIADMNSNVTHNRVDITNLDSVKRVIEGTDVVVHLAVHQLMASFKDILMNANVNIMGTLNILEAARLTNVKKLIFTSASSIVGTINRSPVDEKHPCIPKTPYGVTKLAAEHYLRLYQELYNLDYLTFRFFNIYGPYQAEGLIPLLYKKLTSNQPIDVFGGGNQIRDYVFIKDIVPFFYKAIKEDSIRNMVVNLGTGAGRSVLEVVNIASKILGIKPTINFKPRRDGEIDDYVADVDRLKLLFGTVPSTTLEEGLQKTFNWLRSFG